MQQLWDQILHLLAFVITPDWGSLVALIPLGIAGVVVLYVLWLVMRLATAGPTRTGRRRLPPQPPSGTHLPGGSISPLLISVASALLLFGVVLRGPLLVVGVVALLLAVLNWGREAMRDYERLGAGASGTAGVATIPQAPAGIHLPGPSFRPVLISIASLVALFGLVLGPAILVAGALMLLITVLGWLLDARSEYRAIEEADRTGHVVSQPAPGMPIVTLALFGVLLVGAVIVKAGIFPPSGATSSGAAASSAPTSAPAPSAAAPSGGSAAPGGAGSSAAAGSSGPGGQAVTIEMTAQGIAYDKQSLSAPANTPFTIKFTNNDQGVPHNVSIHKDSPTGAEVWKGDIVTGPTTTTYSVPGLPAGTYGFVCSVHPNMTGTLTIR